MNIKPLVALLGITFFFTVEKAYCQDTLRVLFIGNSYTFFNSLPRMVAGLSASAHKVLLVDSSTVGGYTLENHTTDSNTLLKIRKGIWDHVILQEQSQIPSITYHRYNTMFPAAQILRDSIMLHNPCANIITYMTWGRRYGGRQCHGSLSRDCSPQFADFNQMQDTITKSYSLLSNLITAQCAPVGVAWQRILNDTNFVLHRSDNSHPTPLGSYVAACVIYSSIWNQRTSGLNYTAGLPSTSIRYIQAQADSAVFHNTQNWNININTPQAQFSHLDTGLIAQFTNQSRAERDLTFHWDFGDSVTSIEANPRHTYLRSGDYIVTLVARSCQGVDTLKRAINVQQLISLSQDQSRTGVFLYPNPANTKVHIRNQTRLPMKGKIYNKLGQTMGIVEEFSFDTELPLEHLAKGIYILVLESNSNVFTQNLIKE